MLLLKNTYRNVFLIVNNPSWRWSSKLWKDSLTQEEVLSSSLLRWKKISIFNLNWKQLYPNAWKISKLSIKSTYFDPSLYLNKSKTSFRLRLYWTSNIYSFTVGNRPAWFQKLQTPMAKAEWETWGPEATKETKLIFLAGVQALPTLLHPAWLPVHDLLANDR